MTFNPVALLDKLIVEHGSATVMGQHLSLIKDQLKIAEDKIAILETENSHLKNTITNLESQISKEAIPANYFKYRGVLFHRLANGDVEKTIYCPIHKLAMASFHGVMPYRCNHAECGFSADFNGQVLDAILEEAKIQP